LGSIWHVLAQVSRQGAAPVHALPLTSASTIVAVDGKPATLLDLLDDALRRYADRPAVGLWHDDGSRSTWTYRELDRRIARFAFGDSTAKRRDLPYDAPLRRALAILKKGQTQKDLFVVAKTTPTPISTP